MAPQSFDEFLKQQAQQSKGPAVNRGLNNKVYSNRGSTPFQDSYGSTPNGSLPGSGSATPNPNSSTASLTSLNTALSKLNVGDTPI